MKRVVISLAIALTAMSGYADSIYLGTPSYGGTGCPGGSASFSLSPDAQSLSMLFDRYVVEAGGNTGMDLNRKTCNISVPVHVPQGISIAIFKIDYRGFNALPYGAYSQFNVEYFFAGNQGPTYRKTFKGSLQDNYLITNNLAAGSIVWSPCGKDVNLRVNSSMLAHTNTKKESTMATVDSADLKSGLIYHMQWRRCN